MERRCELAKAKKDGAMPTSTYHEPKRVSVTKADNGYVVSTYGPKGEETKIARSERECNRMVSEMLGSKPSKK